MTRFITFFQVSEFVGKLQYKKEKCTEEVRSSIYGDLVYFKKIMDMTDFSVQFRRIIIRHQRTGYDLNVM